MDIWYIYLYFYMIYLSIWIWIYDIYTYVKNFGILACAYQMTLVNKVSSWNCSKGVYENSLPSNYDYKFINLKKISKYCTGCFEARFRCPILIWLNVISNKPWYECAWAILQGVEVTIVNYFLTVLVWWIVYLSKQNYRFPIKEIPAQSHK